MGKFDDEIIDDGSEIKENKTPEFKEGMEAFKNGEPLNGEEDFDWQLGWRRAQYDANN